MSSKPKPTDTKTPAGEFNPDWIRNGINHDAVKYAEHLGKSLSSDLTTSQIRNIFSEIRRIQQIGLESEKASLLLLKPKLAYAIGRNQRKNQTGKDNPLNPLKDMIDESISCVLDKEDESQSKRFDNFVNLMEAVLAYHKFFGGE